jgi:cellulose synthase/poly-beta-1,6-N-acetylglucosamine synthase-like glycosyltransferase
MPLFSVIIPTYNRAELLLEALESVFAQDFKNFEVIVVDDGSSDNTARVVAGFGNRLKFLKQPNLGPGAARNLGASQATGDYLAFLDSDDVWFPWSLEKYAGIVSGKPAFVAGKPFRFGDAKQLADAREQPVTTKSFTDYYTSGDEWRWWGVSSFVIRRDAFDAIGGFTAKPINGEDADLAMRLGVAGEFVQVVSPPTFGYREHPVSAMKVMEKTLAGARHLISMEKSGCYPGGLPRTRERWRILTRHLRPVAMDCIKQKRHQPTAWALYWDTWRWHITLGRWKFLLGFPVTALIGVFKK